MRVSVIEAVFSIQGKPSTVLRTPMTAHHSWVEPVIVARPDETLNSRAPMGPVEARVLRMEPVEVGGGLPWDP